MPDPQAKPEGTARYPAVRRPHSAPCSSTTDRMTPCPQDAVARVAERLFCAKHAAESAGIMGQPVESLQPTLALAGMALPGECPRCCGDIETPFFDPTRQCDGRLVGGALCGYVGLGRVKS